MGTPKTRTCTAVGAPIIALNAKARSLHWHGFSGNCRCLRPTRIHPAMAGCAFRVRALRSSGRADHLDGEDHLVTVCNGQHEQESFQRNADCTLASSNPLGQRSSVKTGLVRVLSQGSAATPWRGAILGANAVRSSTRNSEVRGLTIAGRANSLESCAAWPARLWAAQS